MCLNGPSDLGIETLDTLLLLPTHKIPIQAVSPQRILEIHQRLAIGVIRVRCHVRCHDHGRLGLLAARLKACRLGFELEGCFGSLLKGARGHIYVLRVRVRVSGRLCGRQLKPLAEQCGCVREVQIDHVTLLKVELG